LQRRQGAPAREGAGGRDEGARPQARAGDRAMSIRALGVEYLNARPLWESLKGDPRVDLRLAPPSEVARALAENEADVGLMPVAAAATLGDLRLLRNM